MLENSVVTLFRHGNGELGLMCLGTFPAWVDAKLGIRNDSGGVYCDNRFDVRIKAQHIREIRPGDMIFFGRAEAGCVKAAECKRIAAVTFNSFGSVPHWHLYSEYRYR